MNKPEHISEELLKQASKLFKKKKPLQKIEQELSEMGYDDESVRYALFFLKKEKQRTELKKGFALILTAAAILLGSFIITVILFHNNKSLEVFMYASTCIGIIIGFMGFRRIFG